SRRCSRPRRLRRTNRGRRRSARQRERSVPNKACCLLTSAGRTRTSGLADRCSFVQLAAIVRGEFFSQAALFHVVLDPPPRGPFGVVHGFQKPVQIEFNVVCDIHFPDAPCCHFCFAH